MLDAGIGRCRLERLFALRYPDIAVEWHGIDLLDFRLRIRDDVPGITRVRGRVDQLPYADQSFDAVVSCWVLQHLEDPEGSIAELGRVLRPEGLLLLSVPNSPQPIKWIQERVHGWHVARQRRQGNRFSYLPQIQFYNLPRLRRLICGVGARPVRVQGVGFVTGGPLAFLENHEWYYKWNLWCGARLPRITKQVICVATGAPQAPGATPARTSEETTHVP